MKRLSIAVLLATLGVACSGTGTSTTSAAGKIGQATGSAGSSGAAGDENTNGAAPTASAGTSGEGATTAAGSGDTTSAAGTGAVATGTADTSGGSGTVAAAGSAGATDTTAAAGAANTTGAAGAATSTGATGTASTPGAAATGDATAAAGTGSGSTAQTTPTVPVVVTGTGATGTTGAAGSSGTTTTGSTGTVASGTTTGSTGTTTTGSTTKTTTGSTGTVASGTGAAGTTGAAGSGTTTGTGVVPPPATTPPPSGVNLCAGLITDKLPHPMTPVARPAVGQAIVDPQFGTTIRRITQVPTTNTPNPALVPLYSTVSSWNADETMMILYSAGGGHQLYDGKTYQFIRALNDVHPADVEQIYWSTTDPDIFFYVDHNQFIRYHVREAKPEVMTTFSFCGDVTKSDTRASGGTDPFFTSFDSRYIGLGCMGTSFIYDISTNTVISKKASPGENPIQASPSGKLGWYDVSGTVTDNLLNPLRKLDLKAPANHSSMGLSPSGVDELWTVVFDQGPKGDNDIGSLVSFDMTTGQSKVIIGPKTGYPYPPTTHVSAMAYRDPGYAIVATLGNLNGVGLLDSEISVANTADGTVCRVGRHRSWGKLNTHLPQPYWAEAHATPSPSGTRIVFASDWGNNTTVDSYVIELPSYKK
jgi:hypothetical protein